VWREQSGSMRDAFDEKNKETRTRPPSRWRTYQPRRLIGAFIFI
jgi:hypothetical protein